MRLYVIGSEGQVARSLREAAATDTSITLGYSSRADIDLLDPSTIEAAVAAFQPDIIVNPAAYTAVDKAEAESEQAFTINRDGAHAVAAAAARCNIPVIHLSTDYVFDGKKVGAYVESDAVNPNTVYGKSKLAGEIAVAQANPRHIILRTAWVYAPFGNNFVRTMLRLAQERDRLRVVNDQTGCPTYAPDIADAVIRIAKEAAKNWRAEYAGVTHIAGPDAMTWHEFARAIVEESALRGGRSIPVDAISTSEYPTPAARPANSYLSTARLSSIFGIQLPNMRQSLSNCLDRILRQREI